jgi:hypothetical protein
MTAARTATNTRRGRRSGPGHETVEERLDREAEAVVAVAGDELVGVGDDQGEPVHRQRAEGGVQMLDGVGEVVAGDVAGRPADVGLGGGRRHDQHQDVGRPCGALAIDLAGLQQREQVLHPGESVVINGAARGAVTAGGRHPDQHGGHAGMGLEYGSEMVEHPEQLLTPVRRVRHHQLDLTEGAIDHRVDELVAIADVDVERGGAGVQRSGDTPHRDRVQPLGAADLQPGIDDRLLRERSLGGAIPGGSGASGGGHPLDRT